MYKKVIEKDIQFFETILPNTFVKYDAETLQVNSKDYTEDFSFLPEVVLYPTCTEHISAILAYCNSERIPVTTRGAGTGLSGGCLPVLGGVVLNMQKMNKILEIDTENLQATVEPGVINEVFQEEVKKYGLFYPPDPASMGSCTLGGNIAHSSGGPRCVKYGTTRDYVLNLEVVLANGKVIQTGANVLKNSTGYNLTQLMVGSEGTLGVVTKIVLKLIAYPTHNALLLASFASAQNACAVVSKILSAGITPSALEFMDKKGVEISVSAQNINFQFGEENAYLLIEVDAFRQEEIMPQCENIYTILEENKVLNVLIATDTTEKDRLWQIRRKMGSLIKQKSVYKEEDTVVPRSYLPHIYQKVEKLSAKYGFEAVCYGHAGDGNLHINILKNELTDKYWNEELPKAIQSLFKECKKWGGTISGEHGIGLVQKPYLKIVFDKAHFQLFKGIKKAFDPNKILNPEKIFKVK